jgi:hypothetical protein
MNPLPTSVAERAMVLRAMSCSMRARAALAAAWRSASRARAASAWAARSWASRSFTSMRASTWPFSTRSPSCGTTAARRPGILAVMSTSVASMRPLPEAKPGGSGGVCRRHHKA